MRALALNDIVVNKLDTGRLLDFETSINGRFVNSHGGDGIVIATATGSTAYALSCGGPIVEPDLDVWVLAPISPHTLSDRPIVVRAGSKIRIQLSDRADSRAQVTCDGAAIGDLRPGDSLFVEGSGAAITLLHPPGYDYYRLLRSKLHWGRGGWPIGAMLTHLQLRDFVIVDHAELDFAAGLTALTGETGAGKSIVVDALAMIAGGRASGDVVREGAQRSEVTAQFAALPQAARDWLDEQAIDHDGEILARRVVGADGRSRAYLNGRLVPLQSLREFIDFLVEIHGQQEFQHLVARDAQRTLVDEHGDARDLARPSRRSTRCCAIAAANSAACAPPPSISRRGANCAPPIGGTPGRGDDGRRHRGAVRRAQAGRRPRPPGGRRGRGARGGLRSGRRQRARSLGQGARGVRGAGGADPALQAVESCSTRRRSTCARRRLAAPLSGRARHGPGRQEEIERRAAALESLRASTTAVRRNCPSAWPHSSANWRRCRARKPTSPRSSGANTI